MIGCEENPLAIRLRALRLQLRVLDRRSELIIADFNRSLTLLSSLSSLSSPIAPASLDEKMLHRREMRGRMSLGGERRSMNRELEIVWGNMEIN
jgi:hypothetical protein